MSIQIVEPSSIRRSANPGEIVTQDFVVNHIPNNGSLVATISGGGSYIRLRELVAFKSEQRWYTNDEINDLPPHLRANARKNGYQELVEVNRVGAGSPLLVWSGLHVTGVIEFAAPNTSELTSESAKLVLEGWGGDPVEVPLLFIIGNIQVEFLVNPILAHRGQEVSLPVRVSLPNSAPTSEIILKAFKSWVTIPSHRLIVQSGSSVTTNLKLRIDVRNAPLGPLSTELSIEGFTDRIIFVPFELEIKEFSLKIKASEDIQNKVAIPTEGPPGLRSPVSDVVEAGGGGFVQRYNTGNIYWSQETGAKWVYGAILQKYLYLGGPTSFLGYPVTDELPTSNRIGRYNDFKNGSIYFSNPSGAHEVHGKIREHWLALGAEKSYLGFPSFDQKGHFSRFEKGTIQLQNNEFVWDASDAREIKTGVIHLNGAAANGWADLLLSSSGGFQFKGSIRSTGILSYDVMMVVAIDLRPFGGTVLVFKEEGDVEGDLILGGNEAHTWNKHAMDNRIKDNWELIRNAPWKATLTVNHGPGDILALWASTAGLTVLTFLTILGVAFGSKNMKACRCQHEYLDSGIGDWRQEDAVVFVPIDQPCPPGCFENGV
ncbi:LGFP repeat-containing protein [Bacillus sp. BS98]|uniref:LGFP repeat-containing protein n=1 Tax=Bacillus TaxID=1386 RepID=UPI00122EDD71|nr:hypothetical protein [Bacillus sp. BS98]QEQ20345.1 hypothetical protein F0362_27555 [Bacillus sp. BS98]